MRIVPYLSIGDPRSTSQSRASQTNHMAKGLPMPWQLQFEGNHATIYGPGDLEIVLRDFGSVRVRRGAVLPPTVRGLSVQRHWRYPLEEGLWLEGLSTSKPEDLLNRPDLHLLHVRHSVYWRIPEEFAEPLHALMEADDTPRSSGSETEKGIGHRDTLTQFGISSFALPDHKGAPRWPE